MELKNKEKYLTNAEIYKLLTDFEREFNAGNLVYARCALNKLEKEYNLTIDVDYEENNVTTSTSMEQ